MTRSVGHRERKGWDNINQKERKYFLSVSLNHGFVRDKSLGNGLSCAVAQVACLAEHAISAMPDELCFLNYSQTCDSYSIRVLFAMDRCLLSKRRFIFILSAFLLNSEIIFNIRSIFLCANAVLTKTLKTFSRAECYSALYKINENIMKVNEKIIAKNWWNLCKIAECSIH